MSKRPQRTRLEKGIYSDRYGISAIVTVRGRQEEKRFPTDTDRDEIRRWRMTAQLRLDLEMGGIGLRSRKHTLEADFRSYLERRRGRACFHADKSNAKAWLIALGDTVKRSQLTAQHLAEAIAGWRAAGKSAQTIKHRCQLLRHLAKALDGPDAKDPMKGIRLEKPRRAAPKAVPQAILRKVAQNLKGGNPKHYARFLVRATTGQRPTAIMKAQPTDVDLERRIWFVRPAKGGDPVPLPLNPGMIAAWRAFIKANAWGTFSTGDHGAAMRDAGWPKGVRPYDLRHTFAIDLLLSGADLGDIQGLMGHVDIQTTRQFYAPILLARLTRAVERRSLKLP